MPRKTAPLIPATERLLNALGERMRLARLRRRLPAKQVAERAGMVEKTLRAVEHGSPAATLGAYAAVLQVLQLEKSLGHVAAEDPLGRELQDKKLEGGLGPRRARRTDIALAARAKSATVPVDKASTVASVGVSSDALLGLLDLPKTATASAGPLDDKSVVRDAPKNASPAHKPRGQRRK